MTAAALLSVEDLHVEFRTASGWSPGPAVFGTDAVSVPLHADQHAIVFDPQNPNFVYIGNDGGIYKSTDMSARWHWTTRAHGMTTTHFASSVGTTSCQSVTGFRRE